MKNIFVKVLFLIFIISACNSKKEISAVVDSPEVMQHKKEVQQTIMKLFDGMRAGDSSMVNAVFLKDAKLFTSFNSKGGKPVFQEGDLQKFVTAVGTPHDEIWNEVIHSYDIRVDDNLAQVWTPYSFFAGEKFSHCGVNAFHLVKMETGWKIFHLADTRRKEGCETKAIN